MLLGTMAIHSAVIPIIAGTDPYWANVVSLLHFDPITDGQTSTTDEKGLTWTFNSANLTTSQKRFGSGSLSLGSPKSISTGMTSGFDFSTGNFTVEMWVKPSNVSSISALISTRDMASGAGWQIFMGADGGFFVQTQVTSISSAAGLASTSVFKHIALSRSGSTSRLFVDGVVVASGTLNIDPSPAETVYIGRTSSEATPYYFNGHIDEVRVTKGVARYTGNFTPSSDPFPNY